MCQKVVIYTRYSSDLQSTRSCVDQEREIRGGLTQKGATIRKRSSFMTKQNPGPKPFETSSYGFSRWC
jgi:hypothetical protein